MVLRLIAAVLLVTWLVLALLAKGGFVHMLLLGGVALASVEIVTFFRSRMTVQDTSN